MSYDKLDQLIPMYAQTNNLNELNPIYVQNKTFPVHLPPFRRFAPHSLESNLLSLYPQHGTS